MQWFEVVVFCLWRLFFVVGWFGIFITVIFFSRISDSISMGHPVDVAIFFDQLKGTCKVFQGFTNVTWGDFSSPSLRACIPPHFFVDEMRCYQHSVLIYEEFFYPKNKDLPGDSM